MLVLSRSRSTKSRAMSILLPTTKPSAL